MLSRCVAAIVCVAFCSVSASEIAVGQTPKIPVTSEAGLPRFSYPIDGSASQLLNSDPATFQAFASKVLVDVNATLDGYDIRDHQTLSDLLEEKLKILALLGKDADALALIPQIRAVQDKPGTQATIELEAEAILRTRLATQQTGGDAYLAAYKDTYAKLVNALPYSTAGIALQEQKMRTEVLSPTFALGAATQLDAVVAKTHALSGDSARLLVALRFFDDVVYPTKAPTFAVLSSYLASQTPAKKPDIWPAREVSLVGHRGLTPVVVGIWDGGSDTSLFPGRVYTDPHPTLYDKHGLATDLNAFISHGDLYPLTAAQERQYRQMIPDLLGIGDIEAGLDTPRASMVKHKISSLPPAQLTAFQENLALFSATYGHGTHVAGIALRDNPAARLLVGRLTYNYKTTPPPPSDALIARMSRNIATFVRYFKAHHVRVVNMSFYDTEVGFEHDLEANGLGNNAAGRKALAQRWYAQLKKAYHDAFASAPEILFVACAANFNNDATFSNIIPASIDLPNLLTVGAVDQAGDTASWTSYGPTVRVYADGYAVVSLLPHGYHVAESGTSMAAPNVTNLAAKMIAIDPALTPTKTIALILKGATKSADGKRLLINPRATLQLLQAHT